MLTVEHFEIETNLGTDDIYYGFDPETDLPVTHLDRRLSELSDALAVLNPKINPTEFAENARSNIDPLFLLDEKSLASAQAAIMNLAAGLEISLEQKKLLYGLNHFAEAALAWSANLYDEVEYSGFLSRMIPAEDEAEVSEIMLDDEGQPFSDYLDNSVVYLAYAGAVMDSPNKDAVNADGSECIPQYRKLAAAYFITKISLAVGALYAATVEDGKRWEGVVADTLDNLIRI